MKTLFVSVAVTIVISTAGLVSTSSFSFAQTKATKISNTSSTKNSDNKIHIKDSHGKWVFDEPPKRVAIINWTITEQVLELGITPVAVADLKGFQKISPQTQLPIDSSTIIDLGSRFTPNFSQLKASKPELIIIGYSQRDLLRPLSNIAPVMYFNNFSRRNNNAEKADERFLILAKLFDKTIFAEDKLSDRDQQILALTGLLSEHFALRNKPMPKVTVASRKGKETWVYLNNSIPYGIVEKLGFPHEFGEKPSKLGTHKLKDALIEQLEGCLIFLNNSNTTQGLKRPNCTLTARTTNTFGGAMSQLYLAKSFTRALLNKFK